jgi:hypothetical protein
LIIKGKKKKMNSVRAGPVIIKSKHSGMSLGVEGSSQADLASIIQITNNAISRPNATLVGSFVLEQVEGSQGLRYFVRCAVSGKYWDIEGASNENCSRLIQFNKHGGTNQQFEFELVDSYWIIKCVHSGKVLDVELASMESGARIIQFDRHGGDNQLFVVIHTQV